MYKNAESLLNAKESLPPTAVRHAVAMSRVASHVRKVNTMLHLIQPPSHDEVILPKQSAGSGGGGRSHLDDEDGVRGDEAKMQLRLLRSAALVPTEAAQKARPLDRQSLDRWLSKMHAAMEGVEVTKGGRVIGGGASVGPGSGMKMSGKRAPREALSASALMALEKKLYLAIRGEYRQRMAIMAKRKQAPVPKIASTEGSAAAVSANTGPGGNRPPSPMGGRDWEVDNLRTESNDDDDDGGVPGPLTKTTSEMTQSSPSPTKKTHTLTTRQLLPYYKLESVHQFMDIFAKVICSYMLICSNMANVWGMSIGGREL
ncbi:hypothetical protein EON64_10240 [archaeon]|nr:MAG: hypothetical protein EON64_10240 [archaeon]